tara:strand:+ start:127 stop:2670 length:2544 start_codon:yes stop_codon:yes gene_type:complete
MMYAQQVEFCMLLRRLSYHFMSSIFSLKHSKRFNAVKIIVMAAMNAILDTVLRKDTRKCASADKYMSPLTLHLLGAHEDERAANNGECVPRGLGTKLFAFQCETLDVTVQELNITRGELLDYYTQLRIPKNKEIFGWEEDRWKMVPREIDVEVVNKIGQCLCSGGGPAAISGDDPSICMVFIEYECLRDLSFFFKWLLAPANKAFPQCHSRQSAESKLTWQFNGQVFNINCMGNNLNGLFQSAMLETTDPYTTPRHPSSASPSSHVSNERIFTEDDVLHCRTLPTFNNALSQRDSELLLSYLCEPYIRIPLVLSFFSEDDRVQSLKSSTLRSILESVLFEPGNHLSVEFNDVLPEAVPCLNKKLMSTPYGLLLNEVHRSPEVLVSTVIRFLHLAMEMDTGSATEASARVVMFILRLALRVENAVSFLYRQQKGLHPSYSGRSLRGIEIMDNASVEKLGAHLASLGQLLRGPVVKILMNWIDDVQNREPMDEEKADVDGADVFEVTCHAHPVKKVASMWFWTCDGMEMGEGCKREGEYNGCPRYSCSEGCDFDLCDRCFRQYNVGTSPITMSELALIQCELQAHVLLLHRNADFSSLEPRTLSNYLSAYYYLSTRYTWNSCDLDIGETELFEVLQHSRRNIVTWLDEASAKQRGVFTAILQDSYFAAMGAENSLEASMWCLVTGEDNIGRYAVTQSKDLFEKYSKDMTKPAPRISDDKTFVVEIDMQTFELRCTRSKVQALEATFAQDIDVTAVLGKGATTLQCLATMETQNCKERRVCGTSLVLRKWTSDDRAGPSNELHDRDYDPAELGEEEKWITEIFEPVRLAYFVPPTCREVYRTPKRRRNNY